MSVEKYYTSVKNIACNGVTDAINNDREYLDSLAKQLDISAEDSKIIEDEVFQPFREYEKEIIKMVSVKFPLDDSAQRRLKDMRISLNLLDKDTEVMESQIFEEKKTLDMWIKVSGASGVSTFAGFASVVAGPILATIGIIGALPFAPIIPIAALIAAGYIGLGSSASKVNPILKRRPAWVKFGALNIE
jgi:hypothetical protein